MGQNELIAKVRELKELKIMASELDAEITALEDALKAEMTARETDEMIVDVFKVRWTKVTSNRFDTVGFKAKYGELYTAFSKPIETRRFSVV